MCYRGISTCAMWLDWKFNSGGELARFLHAPSEAALPLISSRASPNNDL